MILSNITFSNCLFSEKQVVGWSMDEFGMIVNELEMVKMPVVSQDICIQSDIKFFSLYTHETTFCAGFRNGIFMFRQ